LLPPLVLLPLGAVFDRADVVLRDEDDLELPLLDEERELPLFEPPLLLRDELLRPLELPLRDDALRPPVDEAFPPLRPAALFCAELPPRLDELVPVRPPVELFLDDEDEPLDVRLALVAAAPLRPAALF
jgi:hypothetical protein